MRDMLLMTDFLSYLRHSDDSVSYIAGVSVLRTSPPAWELSSFQDFFETRNLRIFKVLSSKFLVQRFLVQSSKFNGSKFNTPSKVLKF